jgi:hypothetical protein
VILSPRDINFNYTFHKHSARIAKQMLHNILTSCYYKTVWLHSSNGARTSNNVTQKEAGKRYGLPGLRPIVTVVATYDYKIRTTKLTPLSKFCIVKLINTC